MSTSRLRQWNDATGTDGRCAPAPSAGRESDGGGGGKTKLKVRIKKWHGVAKWTWGVGDDEDDVCIVCQCAFEGVAPGVKFPGDECPVVVRAPDLPVVHFCDPRG